MEINIYETTWQPSNDRRITAKIVHEGNFEENFTSTRVRANRLSAVYGDVKNYLVQGVSAHELRLMMKIPTNLTVFFPNMIALDIKNCGLKSISRNDLKGLENLREICLRKMDIEELPADLFEDLINLEFIELQENKIKFIGKNIFNHVRNVKFVNLRQNPLVDLIYAVEPFHENFEDVFRFYKLGDLNAYLDGSFHANAVEFFKPQSDKTSRALEDLGKILKCDDFRDFTIKIGENEFKVHKLMLAARSPKLAEMIKQNPDADELIVEDIEVEVFKIILDFIYDDKMPTTIIDDAVKVFVAAGKLKLGVLKDYAGAILLQLVARFNAIELLQLAIKYDDDRLKAKCIEEIKKIFIDSAFKIDEKVYENFELLKVIVEEKLQAEEKIRKTIENFHKMNV